jgi:hypothetical protein
MAVGEHDEVKAVKLTDFDISGFAKEAKSNITIAGTGAW